MKYDLIGGRLGSVESRGHADVAAGMSIGGRTSMEIEPIYAFQLSTLQAALEDWKREQLSAYPHRAELIETVALAMLDFMQSPQAIDHKLFVGSTAPARAGR